MWEFYVLECKRKAKHVGLIISDVNDGSIDYLVCSNAIVQEKIDKNDTNIIRDGFKKMSVQEFSDLMLILEVISHIV